MSRSRVALAGVVCAATLILPSAASFATTPAASHPLSVSATVADALGSVRITGDVVQRRTVTRKDLAALPQHWQRVTYATSTGTETHTFRGPLLTDVLALAQPAVDPTVKNDILRFAVIATATDAYAATISLGEIDPGFGGTEALLALRQDGVALDLPRLTVPGDLKGGRYVSDVVTLKVERLG